MVKCNRADERIRWLAGFPDLNSNPIVGFDVREIITSARSATQKIIKEPKFLKNPSIFVPDGKEEVLRPLKEISNFRISRAITLNTTCFLKNIARVRELLVMKFRNIFFSQPYKEEIKQLTGENLVIGTSNRERD